MTFCVNEVTSAFNMGYCLMLLYVSIVKIGYTKGKIYWAFTLDCNVVVACDIVIFIISHNLVIFIQKLEEDFG